MADALCAEHPELPWFGERGDPVWKAKKLCQSCLVFRECAMWALDQGPALDGVWGSMTMRERSQLLDGRKAG
jgi:hypothetical protein